MDGHTIVEHVQVRLPKVDDTAAGAILDISILDIPLLGNSPVKHGGSRRNLEDLERNALLNPPKRLPDPFTGNASADRVEFRGELVQFPPDSIAIDTIQLS